MGMYNEVFDRCPKCGELGYLQIYQITLGFGGFHIYDLARLKERFDQGDLSASDLTSLADVLEADSSVFYCDGHREFDIRKSDDCCGHSWRPDPATILAIKMLPKIDQSDVRERAIQKLIDAGLIHE